ncbi:MAG TPA: O-antigen ligase family protein [Bryobacteraceae bacterium]|nr:O-antigen ligase family protein [Bryobacteraceae bacterium]
MITFWRDWEWDSRLCGAALCAVPISIALCEICLALALAVRFARFLRHPVAIRPPRIFWFWLAWAGLEIAVWLGSPNRRAGIGEVRHLILIAALFAILPALHRPGRSLMVWKGIFLTATTGSGVLILEFLARTIRFRHDLAAGGDPDLYLRTGGLLHHWMVYGAVEIVVFAALLEFGSAYPAERRWAGVALAVQGLAIALSLTRSLWVSAACVTAIHLLRKPGTLPWRRILLTAASGILLLSATPVRHRITESFQSDYYSNTERVQMWKVGGRMIRQNVVFGIGAGQVEAQYARFLRPGEPLPAYHGHLHNNALQLFAEFGLLVFCAACVFVAMLVRELAQACRWAATRESRFLSRSGLMGLAGFLVMGMMDYTYGHSLALIVLAFAAISPVMAKRPAPRQIASNSSSSICFCDRSA